MIFLQRLLAFVAGLLAAAYGAALLTAAAGWLPTGWQVRPLEFLVSAWRLELWGVGLISLSVGLAAMVVNGGRRRRDDPIVSETELGRLAISRRAVERLVERAARRAQGVRDVRVDLHQDKNGLSVSLVLEVTADVSLPTVSHEVQSGVERYLRETTGFTAQRVNVEIRQVVSDESSKPGAKA